MDDFEFSWSQALERTTSSSYPFSIYVDEDQNIYLTSSFSISKYNANGSQKWKKTFSVKDFSQLRSQACLLQNCKTFPNNRRKHKRELTSQLILHAQ